MNFDDLKTKLLSTCVIIDNEFLNQYINLILNNLNTDKVKFKTQKHHIIPRAFFKHNNMNIDNSQMNTVNLLFKDHILAHYYLAQCSIDYLKYSNQVALFQMLGKTSDSIGSINLNELQLLYEDYCKQNSINNSGENNGNYNHPWDKEQKDQASLRAKQYFENHPEAKLILSERRTGKSPVNKNKNAFYNIIDNSIIYADTCPDGYTDIMPDELRQAISNRSLGNQATAGMIWYNNGIQNKMFHENEIIPEGYCLGRLPIKSSTSRIGKKCCHDSNGNYKYFYTDEIPEGFELGGRPRDNSGEKNPRWGKHCSEETKRKIGEKNKINNAGEKNPACGRHWYHNGTVKCYLKSECPKGFIPGCLRTEIYLKEDELKNI